MLKYFHVVRYTQVGGVSDAVPHTRPLQVNGIVSDEYGKRFGIQRSDYEGPTSITYLINQGAPTLGIETLSCLVRLPHYAQLDEDYSGVARLLEILCEMYDLPSHLVDGERGKRQYQQVDAAMARNPQARSLIQQLETTYDANNGGAGKASPPPLSPEVERFLREMDSRLGEEQG